jgi:hypothetical protein
MIFVRVERGGVDELAHLLAHALDDVRVVVADAGGEDAAEEVEIAVAVRVPDIEAVAVRERQRVGVVEDVVGPEIARCLSRMACVSMKNP